MSITTAQPTDTTAGVRVNVTEKAVPTLGSGPAFLAILGIFALLGFSGLTIISAIGTASDYNAATSTPAILVVLAVLAAIASFALMSGLTINSPGETKVVTFFGRYLGTNRKTGLSLTLPFTGKTRVPVRVLNFETNTLKVNEQGGSPVQASAIVVWQVADTAKATFAVEDYEQFINTQSESALRHVVSTHPYDSAAAEKVAEDGEPTPQVTLRGTDSAVTNELARELSERITLAGLEVIEVRISNLSYAPEIAGAMLQRQQAQAVLDARKVMVEGAVGLVDDALTKLSEKEHMDLDPERRAAMASNLMVVLVGGHSAQPIINTGSLYS